MTMRMDFITANSTAFCWLSLALGILFNVSAMACMKLSEGLTRLVPVAAMFFLYAVSVVATALALKCIPLGTAYAVISAVGTFLTTLIAVLWFHESISAIKLVSLVMIVLGVIGLNLH
jgi:small multidrug resistance pump